jgi:hypothetical protein
VLTINPGAASNTTTTFSFSQQQPPEKLEINLTAGTTQKFYVTTRDVFGNILNRKSENELSMQIEFNDKSNTDELTYSILYQGSGQFSGLFTIIRAGVFKVKIGISQNHILYSPFTCTVIPSSAVGSKSFNTSIIPNFLQAGEISEFALQVSNEERA